MAMESKHIVSLLVVSIILIVLYMSYTKKDKKHHKKDKKSVKENFVDEMMREDNSTFSLFNWGGNDESEDNIIEEETIEHFPQATPMNVIYTDTNGNLSNTSDLGLQNLTVNSDTKIGGDAQFNGNTNTNGTVTGNKIVGKMGDSWGMIWGDDCAIIGKKGNPMRFGFADNIQASGWSEKIRIETDGKLKVGDLSASGSVSASGDLSASGSVSASVSVKGKSVNATESVTTKTLNVSTIKIGNCVLTEGDGGSLRISNDNGYIDIGTQNGGWGHIYTDRPKFAFNKPLTDVKDSPYKDYAKYDKENTTNITVGNISASNISASKNISGEESISGGKVCVGNTCITDKELKYLTTGFYLRPANLLRADGYGGHNVGRDIHMWEDGYMRIADGAASAFAFGPVRGV